MKLSYYLKICFLIFFVLLSFYLMLSLITFHPFDDTYFQFTGNDVFYNIFGRAGALSSDILFFVFGLVAYLFPCMMLFVSWMCFFKNIPSSIFFLPFYILGSIILLFSLCGLIEFFIDDFYHCCSGGIVGYFLRRNMLYVFNDVTINFIFLIFIILAVFLLSNLNICSFLYEENFLNIEIRSIKISNVIKLVANIYNIYMDWMSKREMRNSFYGRILRYINLFRKIFCCIESRRFYSRWMHSFFIMSVRKYFINSKNFYIFRLIRFSCRDFLFKKIKVYTCNTDNLPLDHIQSKYNTCHLNYKKKIDRIVGFVSEKNIQYHQKLTKSGCMTKKSVLQMNATEFFGKKHLFRKKLNLFPSINLLSPPQLLTKSRNSDDILKKQSALLEAKLADYNIQVRVVNVLQGPVVTRFELDLAPGLRSSRISNLSRDLARSLSTYNLRIIEVVPGKPYVGLEIPNQNREIVYLREILDTEQFRASPGLVLGFGKDVSGVPVFADLLDMPHLLIAGTTGSGKSIGINNIIISLLYKESPENVRFIMIDPKMLELSIYNGIPHLITNVVTSTNDVIDLLHWCVEEMERRYKIMASCGARNLKSYNDYIKDSKFHKFSSGYSSSIKYTGNDIDSCDVSFKRLPYIIIVIDEFSDLIISGGKEVELLIIRLSQKARACGMHLILATQRPSVNVITGLIKANIPSRISFSVSSKVDSHTILDQSGAESLLGKGDMLYLGSSSSVPIRIHGAFVSDSEISSIVKHWKNVFN